MGTLGIDSHISWRTLSTYFNKKNTKHMYKYILNISDTNSLYQNNFHATSADAQLALCMHQMVLRFPSSEIFSWTL